MKIVYLTDQGSSVRNGGRLARPWQELRKHR